MNSPNVLFVPDWSKGNPYQKALASALEIEGCAVSLGALRQVFWKRFDILHVHWPDPLFLSDSWIKTIAKTSLSLFTILVAKFLGTRLFWTVHNMSSHEGRFSHIENCATRLMVGLCDGIVAHTSHSKELLSQKYRIPEARIHVIPIGDYSGFYANSLGRESARGCLGYGVLETVFASVGVIRPYKGLPELINAFNAISDVNARLLLAGRPIDDETGEEIGGLCEGNDRIRSVLKFIPDDDLQIYMNAADVIVFPYRKITTSAAVMLAMAFGKAIVAPSLPFMKETLSEAGTIFYDPANADALLGALNMAIHRRTELKSMGISNREAVSAFSWDKIGKKTIQAYRTAFSH